jgi:hypothetical protein
MVTAFFGRESCPTNTFSLRSTLSRKCLAEYLTAASVVFYNESRIGSAPISALLEFLFEDA